VPLRRRRRFDAEEHVHGSFSRWDDVPRDRWRGFPSEKRVARVFGEFAGREVRGVAEGAVDEELLAWQGSGVLVLNLLGRGSRRSGAEDDEWAPCFLRGSRGTSETAKHRNALVRHSMNQRLFRDWPVTRHRAAPPNSQSAGDRR